MRFFNFPGLLAIVTLASFTTNKMAEKVTDYFTLPGPIVYNKSNYNLSWSAHPNAGYYKQEYLTAGEKQEAFTKMIMIEAVAGNVDLSSAVKAKIAELEQRKKTDAVANYQVIENKSTGEFLLDFVISQSSGNAPSVVEWNAYRYTTLNEKGGRKGIMLFAIVKRGYGSGTTNFLKSLKTERQGDINLLAAYKLPVVQLKK